MVAAQSALLVNKNPVLQRSQTAALGQDEQFLGQLSQIPDALLAKVAAGQEPASTHVCVLATEKYCAARLQLRHSLAVGPVQLTHAMGQNWQERTPPAELAYMPAGQVRRHCVPYR